MTNVDPAEKEICSRHIEEMVDSQKDIWHSNNQSSTFWFNEKVPIYGSGNHG